MHRAPAVDVAPRPSRLLAGWILTVAVSTAAVLATLPFDDWLRALAAGGVALWAAHAVRSHARRLPRDAVRLLRVDGNLGIRAVTAEGRVLQGRVLPATYVGSRLTTLVWRAAGERLCRSECLLPDSLTEDDLRRLRVQLRYGRSEDSAGAPASHA